MKFDSRRFMVAQLPFNKIETVKLNTPMIDIMDDTGNVVVASKNLKELGIYQDALKKNINFLEIGCGSGYLLEHLYQHGEGRYFGIEPIKKESDKAKKKLLSLWAEDSPFFKKTPGLSVEKIIKNAELKKATFPLIKFDYIYSYHVFEHLENPLDMLNKAKSWLTEKGKIIITCPNVEGWLPKTDLSNWRCAIPSHRWLPGKSSLIRLLQSDGFVIDKLFTYGGYPAPRGKWQDIANKMFKWLDLGDVICIMASIKSES